MLSGNKGEWSEIYTLIKLLADGEVYAADSELQKKPDIYYPILKIIRDELDDSFTYNRNSLIRIQNSTGKDLTTIPVSEFQKNSFLLFKKIAEANTSSFIIKELENFLKDIHCSTLKARSSDKKDITLVVHDLITQHKPKLGFSIKSKLGGKSTLFNASQSTNITFEVETNGIDYKSINNLRGIKSKVKEIYQNGGSLSYSEIENRVFHGNLLVVDSALPLIIGEMVSLYFQGVGKTVAELVDKIQENNPCNYYSESEHPFYKYKIKNFLKDVAVGLRPTDPWTGAHDATGGYLVVREDGEIVCYHIYNMNEFQDYLLNNTFLDTPSSSRNDFGYIYEAKEKLLMKLNFQIRFE